MLLRAGGWGRDGPGYGALNPYNPQGDMGGVSILADPGPLLWSGDTKNTDMSVFMGTWGHGI